MSSDLHILVAEDDSDVRALVAAALAFAGHDVRSVADGDALATELARTRPVLVISDIRMPGRSALCTLCDASRQNDPPLVIVITAFDDEYVYSEAARLGVAGLLHKPFDPAALCSMVAALLRRSA